MKVKLEATTNASGERTLINVKPLDFDEKPWTMAPSTKGLVRLRTIYGKENVLLTGEATRLFAEAKID
jgi:hypothetical protein